MVDMNLAIGDPERSSCSLLSGWAVLSVLSEATDKLLQGQRIRELPRHLIGVLASDSDFLPESSILQFLPISYCV